MEKAHEQGIAIFNDEEEIFERLVTLPLTETWRMPRGHATPVRKGTAGYGFCFVRIDGAPSIQLMESAGPVGVHHYGFVTDAIDDVAAELKQKGAQIVRENRDAAGRLTTVFIKDPNGLEMEIRSPR
jgi:catechol 2,3-dioxygenase-like lactoylglutathione lyase family enzyme